MKNNSLPSHFWHMCLGAMLFFLSFNVILPELSTLLRSLNGYEYLGWIIPAFSISALVARPLSGWLTDNIGRRWTMIAGCVFCILAGVLYPFIGSVVGFFVVRTIHGFSTGFTPTGFTAFTSDIVPESQRGKAMGWQGLFNNIGTSLGYGLGAMIALYFSIDTLFILSSVFAVFSLILFYRLPETMPKHGKRSFSFSPKQLIYIRAWKPSVLMFLVCISLGSILTIMPDYTLSLGFSNKGLYLTIYIAFSLLVRLVSGKISDQYGRPFSTAIGTGIQILSMIFLLISPSVWTFYGSAVCYGIGQGFNAPSLFAWASDLATPLNRGKSLATLFIALELGIIFGGLFAGMMVTSMKWSMNSVFIMNLIAFVFAFIMSLWFILKQKKGKILIQN